MFSGSCTEDVLLPSRSLSTGEAAAPETFFWLPPGRQQWPGSQNIGKELIVIFLVLGEFFAVLRGSVSLPAGEQCQCSLFVSAPWEPRVVLLFAKSQTRSV